MAAVGGHYIPDLVHFPLTPQQLWEYANKKHSSLLSDFLAIKNGFDGIGHPLGVGQPFSNINSVRRANEWFQAKAEDGAVKSALRGIARDPAYFIADKAGLSSWSPFSAMRGGDWSKVVGSFLGSRIMPHEDPLSPAAQVAYEAMMQKVTAPRSSPSKPEVDSELIKEAKQDIIEKRSFGKLNKLVHDSIITQAQSKRIVDSPILTAQERALVDSIFEVIPLHVPCHLSSEKWWRGELPPDDVQASRSTSRLLIVLAANIWNQV